MARPYVFSADTTLYHPAEPEGRVFPKGSTDPGAAWSDNPGGDRSESKSVAGMVKDLVEANDRADALAAALTRNASDLAEMGKVRDDAVAKANDLAQRVTDAEKGREEAQAIAQEVTRERDRALARATAAEARLAALDAGPANPLDHDNDGEKGGSTASPEKDALMADLAALGVEFDGRLGVAKLRAMLDDATKAQVAA